LAHSQRGWTGARTPSAIKRVRQTARKRVINQPRRAAAKTLVARAVSVASEAQSGASNAELQDAVQRAVSALDLAAKSGAIHRNAANRRKSRLMNKVNAAMGGGIAAPSKAARQTGKAAAAKEAKARIAAGRAAKAKGAQTAAGKARAALSRTSRDAAAAEKPAATAATPKVSASAKPATRAAAKPSASKSAAKTAAKTAAKPAAKKPAAKK
jgi:ribosomal protein S20